MTTFTKTEQIFAGLTIVFLGVGAFVMANVEMPPWAGYASGLNVVLFAIPSFWATRRWIGWRDAILLWALLGVFALAVETFAIVTGFPYGHFGYSDLLGYRILGYTPWTVFLAWTPLVIGAWAVADKLAVGKLQWPVGIVGAAAITVIYDMVLDPGAVSLRFWQYADGGVYYGVPLSNFLGWLVSGSLGALIITAFIRLRKPLLPTPVQLAASAFFIISFWTAFAVFAGLFGPAALGLLVLIVQLLFYFRFHYAFDDMVVLVDEGNHPIGTAQKLPTHHQATPLHRAFSVFLFNDHGGLLLQQRAASKKTWPLTWSNSCCGHVMLHETTADAAKRRLRYELGLRGIELHCILPDFRYRAEKDGVVENEICPVFVGFTSREPEPNSDEVAETKWVSWEAFLEEASHAESGLSPWAIKEAQLLATDPRFTKLFGGAVGRP